MLLIFDYIALLYCSICLVLRDSFQWHAIPGCLDDYLVEILGRINKKYRSIRNIDHGLSSSLLGFVAYPQRYGV